MRISDWSSDVFSSDLILGQHDRRELQPAGAADIIVHIVDEIPERVLADHDDARAGDADARKIVGDEGERQRADRDVAAELRTREPAPEPHPLELHPRLAIGPRTPAAVERGALSGVVARSHARLAGNERVSTF